MKKSIIGMLLSVILVGCGDNSTGSNISHLFPNDLISTNELEKNLNILRTYGTYPLIGFNIGDVIEQGEVLKTDYTYPTDSIISKLLNNEHSDIGLIIDDYYNNPFNPTNRLRHLVQHYQGNIYMNFFGIEVLRTNIQEIIDILGKPDSKGVYEMGEGGYFVNYVFEFDNLEPIVLGFIIDYLGIIVRTGISNHVPNNLIS